MLFDRTGKKVITGADDFLVKVRHSSIEYWAPLCYVKFVAERRSLSAGTNMDTAGVKGGSG